jgi:hypothetical protein
MRWARCRDEKARKLIVTNFVEATTPREDALTSRYLRRHRTISRGALIVVAWTLLAIIRTPSALLVNGLPANSASYWGRVFVGVFASLVPWMLATPLILLVAEKLPLQKEARWRQLVLHLPFAIAIVVTASGAGVLLSRPFLDGNRVTRASRLLRDRPDSFAPSGHDSYLHSLLLGQHRRPLKNRHPRPDGSLYFVAGVSITLALTIRLASAAETVQAPSPHVGGISFLNNTGRRGEFVLPLTIPSSDGA